MPEQKRPLKVFLCHASQDKPVVLELHSALKLEGWIDPWLDKAKILPGQDWRFEIEKAVEESDVVVVNLSTRSVSKEGYVQREIKYAYDIALEKPEETIFLIPLRLDDCIVPRGLRSFHWVNYFGVEKSDAYSSLLDALKLRYEQKLKLENEFNPSKEDEFDRGKNETLETTEQNRQLQNAYDELKSAQEQLVEKERLEKELRVAADIQMSILPDVMPSHERFDFGGRTLASRQVGGDFYDVFYIDDNKIGVLIGDVADKGVPSAVFMARAHALIIAEAYHATSPGGVLRMANKHITRSEKSTQFVTALYGVLDLHTGEFSYARAGHEPPLWLDSQGEVHRLQHTPGMALGLWENIALDERRVFLPAGSLLVMFTDGMVDCLNPNSEPFGIERIKMTMSEIGNTSAQACCDQLLETLMIYQNGSKQNDDVTLVAIHAK
jgi:serine phosphatase RsbU (regulator of sigma subunit)